MFCNFQLKFPSLKSSNIPVEIDVTETNLKTCLNAYKYAVVSKKTDISNVKY